MKDSIELAMIGIREEIEAVDAGDYLENPSEEYASGYRQALVDTIENLGTLRRAMASGVIG